MVLTKWILIILLICLTISGCSSGDVDHLEAARQAVSNQDYKSAIRHARSALRHTPDSQEAKVIHDYTKYADEMLVAAFWSDDIAALTYLAPIVHDVNAKCPRFNTPVLVLAAAWGKRDMVEVLLDAGADPNYGADTSGYTALMWAAKNFDEQLEMIRMLLEAGADVHARSDYDETALDIAIEYRNENVAALLREYGAGD